MSLLALTCHCSSASPLAQAAFRRAGIVDWMSVRLHKGKEHSLTILATFPTEFKQLLAFRALEDFISNHSKFVCIVGYDDGSFYWADVSHGDPQSEMDAVAIIKRFA